MPCIPHRPRAAPVRRGRAHFIAAGRSADKLQTAMQSNVPGIETASYEVAEVPHTVAALTELFRGASVVLNPAGVMITGTMVMINSGGGPGAGSGANPKPVLQVVKPVEKADPLA